MQASRFSDDTHRVQRGTLWALNPILSATLQALCAQAGIALVTVGTARALIDVAATANGNDALFVDAYGPEDVALDRCLAIVPHVTTPVRIIHLHAGIIDDLHSLARCELVWLPPDFSVLTLYRRLRLLAVQSYTVPVHSRASAKQHRVSFSCLTLREQEVSRLVAKGYSNKEIAVHLAIGEGTVKTHIARMLAKLSLNHRQDLIIASYEQQNVNHEHSGNGVR